jgi:hypothetical protein
MLIACTLFVLGISSSSFATAATSGIDKLLLVTITKAENARNETLEASRSQRTAVEEARASRANQIQLQKNAKMLEQLIIDLKKVKLELDKNCK